MRIYSIFTFMAYSCLLKAFTITVPKDLYVVEYGSNVTLECRFPVDKQLNLLALVVYWEMEDKKIIQFVNGEEDLNVQHSSYNQRALLLKNQLPLGKAALQITDVKLQDAGIYCCLISYGGADYKRITLKVNEPYPDPAKKRTHLVILGALLLFLSVTLTIIFYLKRDVEVMDMEKCGTRDMNSKQQNDTQFEET
ncbi:programmed cell death 1 ligand 1 isoform X2 [Tursiops truncatus]|uniref:programmed cell death 1 ligand 1 isoform X2 n=1 Tax=Tursiops truncatus TaxID=9739 RepID=UPI003CCF569A